MGGHRPDANAGRRDRGRDGLPARPQNVRDGSGDGHALVQRLRLARHRRPLSSRRHPTYCAGMLLASEHRQTFSPDSSTEFGGVYVPAENATSNPTPASTQPTSPASGLAPPPLHLSPSGARALSMTAFAQGPGPRVGVSRPTNVSSDPPSYGAGNGRGQRQRHHRWIVDDARFARADAVPAVLRERA
jgi:hypothetical protein